MEKIIAEGKTTNEAISNGLKQLKVPRNMVDVKVLDEDNKRMFYSILTPRVVKVELTVKEQFVPKERNIKPQKAIKLTDEEFEDIKNRLSVFLDDFLKNVDKDVTYTIEFTQGRIKVELENGKIGYLIGYRGDCLYSLEEVLTQVASKGMKSFVRVTLDINGYKVKREETLYFLAKKIAKQVKQNKKDVKLEPMKAYERKLIHQALQDEENLTTFSIGEEPKRRLVVSYVKK